MSPARVSAYLSCFRRPAAICLFWIMQRVAVVVGGSLASENNLGYILAMLEYWKRAGQHVWRSTKEFLGLGKTSGRLIVLALILVLVTYFLFGKKGAEEKAIDALIEFSALALLAILYFVWRLLHAPSELEAKANAQLAERDTQITDLERQLVDDEAAEQRLVTLGELLDEGNNKIFNDTPMTPPFFDGWKAKREDWHMRVNEFLREFFTEGHAADFRNRVLIPGKVWGHRAQSADIADEHNHLLTCHYVDLVYLKGLLGKLTDR